MKQAALLIYITQLTWGNSKGALQMWLQSNMYLYTPILAPRCSPSTFSEKMWGNFLNPQKMSQRLSDVNCSVAIECLSVGSVIAAEHLADVQRLHHSCKFSFDIQVEHYAGSWKWQTLEYEGLGTRLCNLTVSDSGNKSVCIYSSTPMKTHRMMMHAV